MKFDDIAKIRLINQHVGKTQFSSPATLVHHMGALQAQDYNMAKWAMGIRLPGSTLQTIEKAIADGEIIRTHLLRPTWHFIAAHDLRWMLELTAPRIKIAMRTRHKFLGLTEKAITRSNNIIAEALSGGKQLPRKKLVHELEQAGFKNTDNRASHLLLRAELDGVICSGATKGNQIYLRLAG